MNKQIMMALLVGLIIGGIGTFGFVSASSKSTTLNNTMPTSNNIEDNSNSDSASAMDHSNISMDQMSMADMMTELQDKTGDEFDRTFIQAMIAHHQGAIEMAQMAKKSAKNQEIKDLSDDIISAQNTEINQMMKWQKEWGYTQ